MNSFELNKILGAVLGTCLILLALNIGAGALFAPEKPTKPGFDIAVKESGGEKAGAAKEPEQPIEALLAKASGLLPGGPKSAPVNAQTGRCRRSARLCRISYP